MYTYLIIGAKGRGKSEWVKELIRDKRAFVFDVQNEYGSRTKYQGQRPLNFSNNHNDMQARYIPTSLKLSDDAVKFMQIMRSKRNTHGVFEESTVFLEGRTGEETRTLIVNNIHTGNVYHFLFHSIAAVPPRIMQLSNFVVLFPTLDEPTLVARKYSRLYVPFMTLQEQSEKKFLIVKLID